MTEKQTYSAPVAEAIELQTNGAICQLSTKGSSIDGAEKDDWGII